MVYPLIELTVIMLAVTKTSRMVQFIMVIQVGLPAQLQLVQQLELFLPVECPVAVFQMVLAGLPHILLIVLLPVLVIIVLLPFLPYRLVIIQTGILLLLVIQRYQDFNLTREAKAGITQ